MEKIKVTAQQRANAIEARDSVPPANVYHRLALWNGARVCKAVTCETMACFGGWCAWWPSFRSQGIGVDPINGAPTALTGGNVSVELFGHGSLFAQRGYCVFDGALCNTESDHQLVTRRLNGLINNSVVVK